MNDHKGNDVGKDNHPDSRTWSPHAHPTRLEPTAHASGAVHGAG